MKRQQNKMLIIISVIVVFINIVSLVPNSNEPCLNINARIQKPIIELEKDDKIKAQINEKSFPMEYNFCINNFRENDINESEFNYYIEIQTTEKMFPIEYKLIDCNNNQEVKLVDGKSELMKIKKSIKESRKFKVVLNWKELDFDLADELKINLKLNIKQNEEL